MDGQGFRQVADLVTSAQLWAMWELFVSPIDANWPPGAYVQTDSN